MTLQEAIADIDEVLAEAEAYSRALCAEHGVTEEQAESVLSVYRAELAQKREQAIERLIAIYQRGGASLH